MMLMLFFALLGSVVSQTQVDTIYGTVEGLRDNHDGRDFDKFIGIPFAEPPVGDLRWRKPERPAAWDDVYMATGKKGACTQLIFEETSEDCLYLSVYVPDGVENVQDLPVMVWIHGGAFFFGSHYIYYPDELIMHGDVIYVGINYRLGSIGFLSSNDDASPGNYGLWDQTAALQWISENIQAFGGDPDRVTVMGQSAGAASVSHLLSSPHSSHLVSGGIALSGASSAPFGTVAKVNAVEGVKMLNHVFDCGLDDDDFGGIIDCLRLEDAETLDFWAIIGFLVYHQQLPPYLPIIDGDFIADNPRVLWADGAANDKDLLTGYMYDDFATYVLASDGNYSEFAEEGGFASTHESLDLMLTFLLNAFGNNEELKDAVYEEYPDLLSDDTLTRTIAASDSGTDSLFGSPCNYEAIQHTANNGKSTWAYEMHYAQSFLQYPDWVEGSHSDDLFSVFGEGHYREIRETLGDYNTADHETKDYVMSYLTNFAWTGNPNEGPHDIDVVWDPYTRGSLMTIRNNPAMRPVNPAKADHYSWWLEEFPFLVEPNDFTDYVYEDGPLADCEPGFPIDTDCIEAILNITLPFPPERDVTQITWDFERTLADGMSHVVDILSNTVEFSDPDRWAAFEARMERAVIKREESLMRKVIARQEL